MSPYEATRDLQRVRADLLFWARCPWLGDQNDLAAREAIILAASEHGFDGRGSGDLPGFLRMVIERDLRTFCSLLARCIPIDVHSKAEEPERTFTTPEEVQAELEARGIDYNYLALMAQNMAARALVFG